jgi:hypothetical protein
MSTFHGCSCSVLEDKIAGMYGTAVSFDHVALAIATVH